MNRCQCSHCKVTPHASDCALHNEPALPIGPCDCGAMGKVEGAGMNLRELPEPTIPAHSMLAPTDGLPLRYYTADQMRAFYAEGFRAGMERAAQIAAESMWGAKDTRAQIAAAIRSELPSKLSALHRENDG